MIMRKITMVETVASNIDDAKHGYCDLLARWWDLGQQPVHRTIVGHSEYEFVWGSVLSMETDGQQK